MLLELLTKHQNLLIDQGAETYKYNQDIRNVHIKELCNSFNNQSRFHLDKTFYMGIGRAVQLSCLGIWATTNDANQIFKNIIKNLSISNTGFDFCNQLFTPYHESKAPPIHSNQLIEQKKLETLAQSDTAEVNKSDRLQQTIQSAKDVFAQLLKTLFH